MRRNIEKKQWGNWALDLETYTLVYKDDEYWIPLSDMTRASDIMDWLYQIEEKSWATSADIGNLVRATRDFFGRGFCADGQDKLINPREEINALYDTKS